MSWISNPSNALKKYRSAVGIAVTDSQAAGPNYVALHGVIEEVRSLANGTVPAWQYLEDQTATVENVTAKLLTTDIAHFA